MLNGMQLVCFGKFTAANPPVSTRLYRMPLPTRAAAGSYTFTPDDIVPAVDALLCPSSSDATGAGVMCTAFCAATSGLVTVNISTATATGADTASIVQIALFRIYQA